MLSVSVPVTASPACAGKSVDHQDSVMVQVTDGDTMCLLNWLLPVPVPTIFVFFCLSPTVQGKEGGQGWVEYWVDS